MRTKLGQAYPLSDKGFKNKAVFPVHLGEIKRLLIAIQHREILMTDLGLQRLFFLQWEYPVKVLTPHKEIKRETEVLKQRDKAARDLFSQAVSKVRQLIESFFNWLNEKTEIQRASKVRATKGLLVHTFGKLAVALLTFVTF